MRTYYSTDTYVPYIRAIQDPNATEEEKNMYFADLYNASRSYVVSKVCKETWNRSIYTSDIRKDIVQTVFIKVWDRVGKLQAPETYYGWVNTLVESSVRDWYRTYQAKRSRDTVLTACLDDGEVIEYEIGTDTDIPRYNPEAHFEKKEERRLLHKIIRLSNLSRNQHNVLVLTELKDMKLKDAARILNMNLNTVKGCRRTALIKLQRTAAAYGYAY